ncbi:hypothetical protein CRUP_033352 [Coryphaenoides rupestris]|nr:hypothetical protein CRUP_033352 [Coryphaenoides rupestris]
MASNEEKPAEAAATTTTATANATTTTTTGTSTTGEKEATASTWKDSFYNPRTGEVLGRTASSWGLILLFYLVFYCFLAGMFALTMSGDPPPLSGHPRYNDTEQEKNELCVPGEYYDQGEAEIIGLKPLGKPYINCTAKANNPIQMQYFPREARFDKMYFPYYGKKAHESYVQPLVAVKLLLTQGGVQHGAEHRVVPTLKNHDDRDKFLGRITFRVKVFE